MFKNETMLMCVRYAHAITSKQGQTAEFVTLAD